MIARHDLIRPFAGACLVALTSIALPSFAQTAAPADAETSEPSPIPEDFASPRATIATFFLYTNQAVEDEKNEAALAQIYRTMDVPEAAGDERGNMAVKLLGFFNSLGKIEVETMAPDVEKVEADRLSRFEFFPNNAYPAARALIRQAIYDLGGGEPPASVVLVRTESGEWKFSSETMNGIGELWSWIEVRGVKTGVDVRDISTTERIRARFVPGALKGRFVMGFELWQWVGLVLMIFLAVVGDRLSRILLRPLVRSLTLRAVGETAEHAEHATLRPVGMLVGVVIFELAYPTRSLRLTGNAGRESALRLLGADLGETPALDLEDA